MRKATWRNHFSQPLNVHAVNGVRQTEIQTAEPPVLESSAFEFMMAIEKIKGDKSPDTGQIPAEMFKAGCRTISYQIHKLITSVWKKGGIV